MKNCTCVSWSDSFPHCVDVHKIIMFVFLAAGIVEDGAVPVFSFEFTMFVRPEIIFQWESLFFCFQAYWKWIFQWESLFLWFQHYWNWFLNESLCFFGVKPIENGFFNESVCFFGLRPFENGFFNETVCFFGLRHCGRRCCALFPCEFTMFLGPALFFQWECLFFWPQALWKTVLGPFFLKWIYSAFRTRINFSMRVFFLVSSLLKISMKVFVFLGQAYWKWIFQWECLFFWS